MFRLVLLLTFLLVISANAKKYTMVEDEKFEEECNCNGEFCIDSDNCDSQTKFCTLNSMPYMIVGKKRFYFGILEKKNWYMASKFCRSRGMDLAQIGSEDEQQAIENACSERLWIGGTDMGDKQSNYFWTANGCDFKDGFTNWDSHEPNNGYPYPSGREHCTEINRNGKWNDQDCLVEIYFVCQKNDF
ncbi:collectin-10-like isoform X2 [Contarinia nasturtii]|uniref:collectin-10-like isoform X2 n=1 Tax=Contarinia nasturtii TaxID=265458 RepID=UPI0012D393FC|nr:collectin-10-like isoform X2 [Contarinia nasturtii]